MELRCVHDVERVALRCGAKRKKAGHVPRQLALALARPGKARQLLCTSGPDKGLRGPRAALVGCLVGPLVAGCPWLRGSWLTAYQ